MRRLVLCAALALVGCGDSVQPFHIETSKELCKNFGGVAAVSAGTTWTSRKGGSAYFQGTTKCQNGWSFDWQSPWVPL